jgi:hypothetical protein
MAYQDVKIGDTLVLKVLKVETVLVAKTILRILLLLRSETMAMVMSEEITIPWGPENLADEPTPSAEPIVPDVLPATREDTTFPPVKSSFLTLLVCSTTNAKVSSNEISMAYGVWNAMLSPVPSA